MKLDYKFDEEWDNWREKARMAWSHKGFLPCGAVNTPASTLRFPSNTSTVSTSTVGMGSAIGTPSPLLLDTQRGQISKRDQSGPIVGLRESPKPQGNSLSNVVTFASCPARKETHIRDVLDKGQPKIGDIPITSTVSTSRTAEEGGCQPIIRVYKIQKPIGFSLPDFATLAPAAAKERNHQFKLIHDEIDKGGAGMLATIERSLTTDEDNGGLWDDKGGFQSIPSTSISNKENITASTKKRSKQSGTTQMTVQKKKKAKPTKQRQLVQVSSIYLLEVRLIIVVPMIQLNHCHHTIAISVGNRC